MAKQYLVAISVATMLAAQVPNAPAPADPVIRVSVDLVQVDATVTDADGRHVTDLQASDFEVLEDGQTQRITHFSFVPAGRLPVGSKTVAPRLGERPAVNAPTPTQPLPKAGDVARSVVLMADDLGISFGDMPRIKSAMRKFVAEGVQPGDVVSVFASSGGTGVLQRFTRDRTQLLAAVERLHWIPGRLGASAFAPIALGDPTIASAMARINAQQAGSTAARNAILASGTIGSIRYAVQGLAGMPGRRALVIVSEGLAYSPFFDDLVDLANRSGVVIDVVDARGVVYAGLTAADDVHARVGGNPTRDIRREENRRGTEYAATRDGLERLAKGTGGIFVGNNNDIAAALQLAMSDSNDYYLIGYNPSRSDYGPAFHRIQVRVLRPGLQVRTRSGFMGKPDATVVKTQPTRAELLRQALFSPFQGNVPLRLRVIHSAGPADAKTEHRQALLRGRVEIDPKTIEFREGPDGIRTAVVDISGTALGIDGQSVPGADQTYTISLNPKEYEETMASGLFYELLVVPPRPGSYQFVVGLRDTQSGNTGSANAYVEVPDVNARKLGLSSIELGAVGSTDRIRRTFQSGSVLEFAADVYGARKGAGKVPQIEFAIRLHRGPEQIFTGKPIPMARQIPGAQPVVSGEIKLPPFLPPGDYAVELVVRDKLATGKTGTASEWAEFTLLPGQN